MGRHFDAARGILPFEGMRDGLARCALWWWTSQQHPIDTQEPADVFLREVAALLLGSHLLGIFSDNITEENFIALLERGLELEQGDWADFLAIL